MSIRLNIKNPSRPNDVATIEAQLTDSILQVKRQLNKVYHGNPNPADIKIIFAGQMLRDEQTLSAVFTGYDTTLQTLHIVVRPPAARAPSGVVDAPPPAARAPDGVRAPAAAPARRAQGGIHWGLLLNLGFMVFLFSGGVWRNTIMITLAILIYLSQTGLLNLQFQFNFRNNNNNAPAPPAAAGAPNAEQQQPAAPAPTFIGELVTFFATLVISLFPGYNPPVVRRQQPQAPAAGGHQGVPAAPGAAGVGGGMDDDEDDPEEVLRRIDEVYEQQERERERARERQLNENHED